MLSVKELSGAEKVPMPLGVHCDPFLDSGSGSGKEIANKSKICVCKLYIHKKKNRAHISFYCF